MTMLGRFWVTSNSDGAQTRSFCYVDDLVDGFLRMMKTDKSGPGHVNLGNPGEFAMRELAETTIAQTGPARS